MRLLCWNVAGRVQRLTEQVALIADLEPDVVCLQEITARTRPTWVAGLAWAGLAHVSLGEPRVDAQPARRVLQTLTATREPSSTVPVAGVPWPERVVSTRIGSLEVVNVHSPTSPKPGLAKVRTHDAVHRHLAGGSGARVVCGDLNTPRKEHPDGRVWTFARDRYGRLRPERGERWDRAELALIKGLEPHGFSDAFRTLHGMQTRELSWAWQRWGGGYRLDHLIVSAEVSVTECRYLHEWRERGASDHSALTAELDWR
jgi:exonuclease III